MSLIKKTCTLCQGGIPPLTTEQISPLLSELSKEWEIVDNHHLKRHFTFPDFLSALDFTNHLGQVAEEEGHHPNITLTWGSVTVVIYTHKIDGLHESDFILAAKYDYLYDDIKE